MNVTGGSKFVKPPKPTRKTKFSGYPTKISGTRLKGQITGKEPVFFFLNAKEELRKFKYFTMQKYKLQENPLKEAKILEDIITL